MPDVGRAGGRYRALVTASDDDTLWFNFERGRLDAKLLSFPFDVIARRVGVGTTGAPDPVTGPPSIPDADAVLLCGLLVHDADLGSDNWSFAVAGHRGATLRTVEVKHTLEGVSAIGALPSGTLATTRADLRMVGDEAGNVTAYWQEPGTSPDNWTEIAIPGTQHDYGAQVYVGLITYHGHGSRPFVGTCDALESS